jgi:tubulin polyglutamylase TTLL5
LKKQKECIVVSEYIHNPLLVNGLKFDMRIYAAITCFNPLRIYIYEDGLARFATSEYSFDLSTKENMFAHLTNYSLNKFS